MQLSVGKHYIQFALKYIILKYVISIVSTLFKSMLKCTSFSWGHLQIIKAVRLQLDLFQQL